MKNVLIGMLTLVIALMFIACEKMDAEGLRSTSELTTQKTQQAVLENLQNQRETYLASVASYSQAQTNTSRSNSSTDLPFSLEKATVGMSFIVDGESIYDIPDCTVIITDNGDFNTYAVTAIDRFEEIDNIATYSMEFDVAKSDKSYLPRIFDYAWPMFSAWPVPTLFFFGTWSADLVAEDDNQVVIEVPLEAPFVLNRFNIALDNSGFTTDELEGVVRITALKK